MTTSADCGGCELAKASRRAFLRDMAMAAIGAIAINALVPAEAMAAGVTEVLPAARRGTQRVYSLPASDSIQVDVDNEVIIARWQNRVYAFSTKCPHKGAKLEWRANEKKIFCPKHKARFDADGQHFSGRRSRSLDRYDLARAGDSVTVNVDALRREDRDAEAWKAAVVVLG
ncbi:MAG TPA: Rieske (2Fe-2S) protein [Gemmatimonadaceae bacterium]|nr:Rieske (2Fe-2S) protein [Gemmatimonadaceae bacterium]